MIGQKSELLAVLRQFNPWWRGQTLELPKWRRAAFAEVRQWVKAPPAPRAMLLSGARQIGKTTLLLQAIESLLVDGIPPGQILYATFDHPLLKLAGLDGLMDLWREIEPANLRHRVSGISGWVRYRSQKSSLASTRTRQSVSAWVVW